MGAFEDMQIGPAYAGAFYPHQRLARPRRRSRPLNHGQFPGLDAKQSLQPGSLQPCLLSIKNALTTRGSSCFFRARFWLEKTGQRRSGTWAGAGSDRLEFIARWTPTELHFLQKAAKNFKKFPSGLHFLAKNFNFLQKTSKNFSARTYIFQRLMIEFAGLRLNTPRISVTPASLLINFSASDLLEGKPKSCEGRLRARSGRVRGEPARTFSISVLRTYKEHILGSCQQIILRPDRSLLQMHKLFRRTRLRYI